MFESSSGEHERSSHSDNVGVSATGPLQTIVDSLAADIRRDVAIDDRRIRWLVHSPHHGEHEHLLARPEHSS